MRTREEVEEFVRARQRAIMEAVENRRRDGVGADAGKVGPLTPPSLTRALSPQDADDAEVRAEAEEYRRNGPCRGCRGL